MKKKSLAKHMKKKRKKKQQQWYLSYENGKEETNLAIIHQLQTGGEERG